MIAGSPASAAWRQQRLTVEHRAGVEQQLHHIARARAAGSQHQRRSAVCRANIRIRLVVEQQSA